jgi:hypothetical protein
MLKKSLKQPLSSTTKMFAQNYTIEFHLPLVPYPLVCLKSSPSYSSIFSTFTSAYLYLKQLDQSHSNVSKHINYNRTSPTQNFSLQTCSTSMHFIPFPLGLILFVTGNKSIPLLQLFISRDTERERQKDMTKHNWPIENKSNESTIHDDCAHVTYSFLRKQLKIHLIKIIGKCAYKSKISILQLSTRYFDWAH